MTVAPEIGRNARPRVANLVPKKDIDTSLSRVHIDTAPSNRGRRDEMPRGLARYVHKYGDVYIVGVWGGAALGDTFFWPDPAQPNRTETGIGEHCPYRFDTQEAAEEKACELYWTV